ncbi:MAG: cyclase family protein [Christensenella sp.]|uniref:cyclase family protein n=1 Tax=Christensenella sp. TaxID=1935934 RepID=UPI002B2198E2|nr:cyclase family protein [Christensenella sp.]MEA5003413.1 cyclase family protein [Christensenella sp.]
MRCRTIKIIDITQQLGKDTKIYEGDPHIRMEKFFTVDNYGYAVSKMSMGSHSGTHIDAPAHVMSGGKTVRDIPLSDLVGDCIVVEKSEIKIPKGTKRLIIKGSEKGEARISERHARILVDAGIRIIGTDALSIGNDEVHKILLSEEVCILESLELSRVTPGNYFLCALPLKVDTDGSPIRACLIEGIGE